MAVQHLTNYNPSIRAAEGDAALAKLNLFFARFETESPGTAATAGNSPTFTMGMHEVRRTQRGVNQWKATGPDGFSGRVLKDCANQLAGIFTKIFNLSLTVCCPILPEDLHCHPPTQEIHHDQPERLPAGGTHTGGDEML